MLKTLMGRIGYRLLIIAMIAGLFFVVNTGQHRDVVSQGTVSVGAGTLAESVVDLNGAWEFYPDQLLEPKDFLRRKYSGLLINVPEAWNRQYVNGGKFAENLCGTYRLIIKAPAYSGQILGIAVDVIRSSNRIYINGLAVGNSGTPGIKAETTVAGIRPSMNLFVAKPENEIIIQVANFVNSNRGGIVSPISFGTGAEINAANVRSIVADVIIAVLFVAVLAIFAGQYFQRNKELELLWFSSFCLFALLMYISLNNRLIFYLDPNLPYENFARIAYNAVNWSIYSLLLYVRTALKIKQPILVYVITGLMLVWTLMIILLPLPLFTGYFGYMLVWDGLLAIVVVGFAGYGIYRQMDGFEYLTFGTVCFILMYLATLFDFMGILDSDWYVATVSGLFLISQLLFINERYRLTLLKRQQDAFELEYLRAQIKPHFIFNALGSIGGLMLEDVSAARKTLSDFSRYLRGMFRKENLAGHVLVEEELQLTQYYLHIEKVRYGDRLLVSIDVPVEVLQQQLPPLTLQPIAENCVKHGFADSNKTVEIKISGMIKKNKTIITIEDNGSGISTDKLQEILSGVSPGIGLTSTIARLRRVGGNLELISTATGLKVVITL